MMRALRYGVLIVGLGLGPLAAPAEAATAGLWQEGTEAARSAASEALYRARQAIIVGGAVLYQYRNTVSGAVLGCAAGSVIGASSAVALGAATGGAALVGTGHATAAGCALGAAGGAALGLPLDTQSPGIE